MRSSGTVRPLAWGLGGWSLARSSGQGGRGERSQVSAGGSWKLKVQAEPTRQRARVNGVLQFQLPGGWRRPRAGGELQAGGELPQACRGGWSRQPGPGEPSPGIAEAQGGGVGVRPPHVPPPLQAGRSQDGGGLPPEPGQDSRAGVVWRGRATHPPSVLWLFRRGQFPEPSPAASPSRSRGLLLPRLHTHRPRQMLEPWRNPALRKQQL